MRPTLPRLRLIALLVAAHCASARAASPPARTIDDYRHFRALSIDLVGRAPTPGEIAAFERADFDWDRWIDARLQGPGYVDRLRRVYMDLLRLEISPVVNFAPPSATLRRVQILGPEGKPEWIYYRQNQRRYREATDGEFCLTKDESGLSFLNANNVVGPPKKIAREILDANTVLVRPWWLYRDYLSPHPGLRWREGWTDPDPLFQPIDDLLAEPDRSVTREIRVCKEEAQTADSAPIHLTHRKPPPKDAPLPFGRVRPLPLDDGYAVKHAGESLSCRSALALSMTVDCGCGPGLIHCMPGDSTNNDPRAFALPTRTPIGLDQPITSGPQNVSAWHRLWWSEEAAHFFGYLFGNDRDFREVLTARWTLVNGPLAHFYRSMAPANCCGREKAFGMTVESEPLVDASALPQNLFPSDVHDWRFIADRGPHAAGILTMPVFLMKYASRRARGAVLYNAFFCKSFVAGKEPLQPSTEPNLMVRPGCAACHQTLEPIAAWFSRVEEGGWTFLPEWQFPLRNLACKRGPNGKLPGFCDAFYDVAFSDSASGLLRGAYASVDHAAAGPVGAGSYFTTAPEFATCAVERVAASFLGRSLNDDDAPQLRAWTEEFIAKGYKMRPLVRAIVRSPGYRDANNARAGGQ